MWDRFSTGEMEHKASIGYLPDSKLSFKASELEGELGFTMLDKEVKLVKSPPGGMQLTYKSVVGDIKPYELINVPLISGEDEQKGVNHVLNAAALTYVAGLVTAVMQLLYFISLVGGSSRRR